MKDMIFKYNDEITIEGSESNKSAKINFMTSLPISENDESFDWLDPELSNLDEISIIGGSIKYEFLNKTGPSVHLDLYTLYDRVPTMHPEVMSRRTVATNWDPLRSSLSEKFRISREVSAKIVRGDAVNLLLDR